MKKAFLGVSIVLLAGTEFGAQKAAAPKAATAAQFSVFEASIPEMQAALNAGRTTSHAIVQQYLTRIATYEDKLHAAITVNQKALEEADDRDRERSAGRIRGPLHGIPIALKDNIQTTDMPTTGGALAFDGMVPPYEATLTKHLREAGAIIVAKTGLTELANYVAANMPTNYNAIQGYGFNPYDPRRDPRPTADGRPALQTGGSSSGIGTAANFWAGNVGTETSGSILSPSNQNMLAAIKPTVGRISRYGVIPITADQDTPGPMAKYVSDIAIMFGVLEGAADPNDEATNRCAPPPGHDYTKFLKADGLKGARIGIPRANFYDPITLPGSDRPRGGLNPSQAKVIEGAIAALKAQGAVIIDPVEIPSVVEKDPKENLLQSGQSIVLNYGMKRDFNKWLASLGPAAPVKSLTELREWNTVHEKMGTIKYGQSQLDASDKIDLEKDRAKYEEDRARDIRLAGTNGIDAAHEYKAGNRGSEAERCQKDGSRPAQLFNLPSECIGAEPEKRGPHNSSAHVEHEEPSPVHAIDAREQRRQRAENREKSSKKDDLAAMPLKQVLTEFDAPRRHAQNAAVSQQEAMTKNATDPEADAVPRDRSDCRGGNDQPDVQPVRRPCINCCRHQRRLPRQRQAHAFKRHDNADNGISLSGDEMRKIHLTTSYENYLTQAFKRASRRADCISIRVPCLNLMTDRTLPLRMTV